MCRTPCRLLLLVGSEYGEAYGVGDVLGMLITLPETEGDSVLSASLSTAPVVGYKGRVYFESRDVIDKTQVCTSHDAVRIEMDAGFFQSGSFLHA